MVARPTPLKRQYWSGPFIVTIKNLIGQGRGLRVVFSTSPTVILRTWCTSHSSRKHTRKHHVKFGHAQEPFRWVARLAPRALICGRYWGAKTRVDLMRKLGHLSFSPRGHPLWSTPRGNTLSLAQFWDNIVVGAQGPTAKSEMQQVCSTLSEVWTLPVLCDCMTVDDRVCESTCMTTNLTAMGLATHLREEHPPLIYAQPSGLTSDWHLKCTVTLQTPTTHAHKHLSSVIVSAV